MASGLDWALMLPEKYRRRATISVNRIRVDFWIQTRGMFILLLQSAYKFNTIVLHAGFINNCPELSYLQKRQFLTVQQSAAMKILLVFLTSTIAIFWAGCSGPENKNAERTEVKEAGSPTENIPYTLAKNYFVKNTFTGELANPKISSETEFNAVFGMATTMGAEGKPTPIDFTSQFVIAVIPSKSDTSAIVNPDDLSKTGNEILLKYSITKGEKQSFVSQPYLLLVVDNKYSGEVKTERTN